jgi:hypothetical protein
MSSAAADLPVPASGIFLSYSHRDSVAALTLKRGLERLGVGVRLDTEAMKPGQRIRDFIVESIRATVATVWIVSEASLVSDWVAVEIMTSLHDAELWGKRKLIACYLDQGFLDIEFRLRATELIDKRLAEIEGLLPQYADRRLDTNDLNAEKTRLFDLRHDLGALLDRLKGSLSLDLRAEQAEASVTLLANTLRPLAPAARRALYAASDIERRRRDIYDLIGSNDVEQALNHLMDFVRDFSEPRRQREVTILKSNYLELERLRGASLKEVRRERTRLLEQALSTVDDTVDALAPRVS